MKKRKGSRNFGEVSRKTLSSEQCRIYKEKMESKEAEPGTLLLRKTTFTVTKIRFPFSTERTAGDSSEKRYSDQIKKYL